MRIEELETPAVVVDLDVLERNISTLAEYSRSHGLRLRPHTKTHKIPEIAAMQVAAGCRGLTVAKVGEAEVMSASGLDDILVHYPVLGSAKLLRLAKLARDTKITVAIDSPVTAEALADAARHMESNIHVLVEIDTGMRRCGVASPSEAEALAQKISVLGGLRFAGITTYPGHIWLQPAEQEAALKQVGEQLEAVLTRLRQSGFPCEVVSAGSTPTARNSHLVGGLTEIRPGTYVFNDRNTAGTGACTIEDCALRILVTVVSTAVGGRAIIDGGTKTFAADRYLSGSKIGFGHIVEQPDIEIGAMSEEHGHLELKDSSFRPRVGDRLSVIPNHVCPCVNLHETIHYHRAGVVEGSWTVAGRGKVR